MNKLYKQVSCFAINLIFIATTAFAQTYILSGPTQGQGPLLNTESTSSSTGWTMIHDDIAHGGGSVNSWSDPIAVGFNFEYFGTRVDSFCVSKNYLLTFNTSVATTTLPSSIDNNTSLPDGNLPDSTIAYLWCGFGNPAPLGTNDEIWVKTFGTSPNRQLWVKNFSFECEAQSFTYNFVVLEESTNNIYVVDARNATANTSTRTVGVQLNSLNAIQDPNSPSIASIHSNVTTPWPTVTYWEFSPPIPNDVSVNSVDSIPSSCSLTSSENVTVEIVNTGINTQTSIPVMYSLNGGLFTSAGTWTGSLASLDTTTHTFQLDLSSNQLHEIAVATNLTNDGFTVNDSGYTTTINYPEYNLFDSVMVCTGDSFVFPDNTVQTNITSPVTQVSSLMTGFGCDSIITTYVDVNPNVYTLNESVEACSGDSIIFPDGTIVAEIDSDMVHVSNLTTLGFGCDSIITTTVNVTTVDIGVTVSGTTITASATNATYKWLDCIVFYDEVPGETSQSFTATMNGRFAVEVTQNSCVDTSVCTIFTTIGLGNELSTGKMNIYPNPTESRLNIEFKDLHYSGTIELLNMQGEKVLEQNVIKESFITLNLDQSPGVYILQMTSNQSMIRQMVVIR